eukprot:jgi/Botrbrau1/23219/Bobra.0041s0062.2
MSPPPSGPPLPLYKNFAASAIAACTAEVATLPLDLAKVRLQLQSKSHGTPKYRGLFGTMVTVAKEEGPGALWAGIEPSLHRQILYGGLRIGLYDPVKRLFMGNSDRDAPLLVKVGAGMTTGALAIAIASPTDLVKVRMQAEGKLPPGTPKRYPNAVKAYGMIVREQGLKGLWRGLGPNIARNAIINAAELASYDQIKQELLKTGYFGDNVITHLAAGLGAGFFAVCCGSPVDVVKSRMMGDTTRQYSGVLDCFVKTWRNNGFFAFYQVRYFPVAVPIDCDVLTLGRLTLTFLT